MPGCDGLSREKNVCIGNVSPLFIINNHMFIYCINIFK